MKEIVITIKNTEAKVEVFKRTPIAKREEEISDMIVKAILTLPGIRSIKDLMEPGD